MLSRVWERIEAEPAVVGAIVSTILTLAVSFGLNLTTDQMALVVTLVNLIVGLFVRNRVTPV